MRIDKKTVQSFAVMPDDKLKLMLNMFLGGKLNGDISDVTLNGIRTVALSLTDGDIERISELITVYKNGKAGRLQ